MNYLLGAYYVPDMGQESYVQTMQMFSFTHPSP